MRWRIPFSSVIYVCRINLFTHRDVMEEFLFLSWFTSCVQLVCSLIVMCWGSAPPRVREKLASSNLGRSWGRILISRVNFVCWLLFGVRSTLVLTQWHVKDPGHCAKSAGGRLHLNKHTPLTQRSRRGLTMPLSRPSVGTYQETNSHASRQGTLGQSRLSSLSHCGLILAKRVELVCAS